MATITKKVETARGCGYRKKGGLYLVTNGVRAQCGKLPIPLTVCPCCGAGIKFSRGFTWVTGALFESAECKAESLREDLCYHCPFSQFNQSTKFGLMWVGEKFYTPDEFVNEAMIKGISKRIAAVPHDFKIGETWILLAHIKAIEKNEPVEKFEYKYLPPVVTHSPGIFYAFKPSAIEYVITGSETEDQLTAMEKRGITLIDVVRDIDQQTIINYTPNE